MPPDSPSGYILFNHKGGLINNLKKVGAHLTPVPAIIRYY